MENKLALSENDLEVNNDISKLKQQVRLHPHDPKVHFNLGVGYGASGDSEKGLAELKEAIRLKKDYAEAFSASGLILAMSGDYSNAIMEYRKAIRINPSAESFYDLALSYRKLKRFRDAIDVLKKSIRLKDDVDSHLLLAHTYADVRNFKEAAESFKRAVRMQPHNNEVRADFAHSLFLSGQKALALREVLLLKKTDRVKADIILQMIKGNYVSKFRGR